MGLLRTGHGALRDHSNLLHCMQPQRKLKWAMLILYNLSPGSHLRGSDAACCRRGTSRSCSAGSTARCSSGS